MTFRHQVPRSRHRVPPYLPGADAPFRRCGTERGVICMRYPYAHSSMGRQRPNLRVSEFICAFFSLSHKLRPALQCYKI